MRFLREDSGIERKIFFAVHSCRLSESYGSVETTSCSCDERNLVCWRRRVELMSMRCVFLFATFECDRSLSPKFSRKIRNHKSDFYRCFHYTTYAGRYTSILRTTYVYVRKHVHLCSTHQNEKKTSEDWVMRCHRISVCVSTLTSESGWFDRQPMILRCSWNRSSKSYTTGDWWHMAIYWWNKSAA